ncbi:hypothetical protein IT568_12925 [bacterium]|nr:hypothetical protein [bacterium]
MRKLIFVFLISVACNTNRTPEQQAAENFIGEYFVYVDQQKALPYTTGFAKIKIQNEITEVNKVRNQNEKLGEMLSDVEFLFLKELSSENGKKGLVYRLKIENDGFLQEREVIISLENENNQWLVSNFSE